MRYGWMKQTINIKDIRSIRKTTKTNPFVAHFLSAELKLLMII
ncbi:PH domain-containing protein [Virgibacillus dokdonensis]